MRTSRGREATLRAYQHLGKDITTKKNNQNTLFD